jgi:hypothetical protein
MTAKGMITMESFSEEELQMREMILEKFENTHYPIDFTGLFESYADMEPAMDRALVRVIEGGNSSELEFLVKSIQYLMAAGICPFSDGEDHKLYWNAINLLHDIEKSKEVKAA